MSSAHARITRVRGSWVLEDTGSRNGTRVGGELVEQRPLSDGDTIELGRTLLLFREGLPRCTTLDLDEAATKAMTLVPSLEMEFQRLARIARASNVSILIEGESGSGKEVLARQISEWAGRSNSFVAVNCGALAENLVESELFGATRGAFSGATHDRIGFVRSADKGTLFLDEIAELPLPSQATLLRVLQEHEVVPVGSTKPIPVDIQVLSATHQDLERRISAGQFRQDLFARVSGFKTRLPTLAERKEDLGVLIRSLLSKIEGGDRVRFTSEAVRMLLLHTWPLNVRELGHMLQAAVLLSPDGLIDAQHLPTELGKLPASRPPPPLTSDQATQRDELIALLRRHEGNISAVARDLGKARMQVQRWLKRYDLDAESYRL